jgi:hypothetical protein
MPDRTIAILSWTAGALFLAYLVLVIATVSLAAMQTSLAAEVRSTEGGIAELESTYYATLARENASTPSSVGLVAPASVAYATAKPAQSLTFAGN